MTQEEKIKAEIENRIKEHKKQLKKKTYISVISEAMLKGSLGAYESLLNYIEHMNDGLSPEDKLMKAIFGKPIGEMTQEEAQEAYKAATGQRLRERDLMFENALSLIQDLTTEDYSFLCESVIEHEGEWCEKYCTNKGDGMPTLCLVKALKYYKKDG